MRTRYAALAATFVLLAALAATIILTSKAAEEPTSVAQQTAPHLPRDAPATPTTPMPPDRCTTPTDPTCIRAVYKGAPDDYTQVQDIPDSVLIQPDDDGRYQVERGQQITVVTAALLPTDYTRFDLQRQSELVSISPTSFEQLIQPIGTTYTFTRHNGRGCVQPDQLRPDCGPRTASARPETGARRRRGHDQLPGPKNCATTRSTSPAPQPPPAATPSSRPPAMRPARSATSAILPPHRRVARTPNRCERGLARGLLRHGATRRHVRRPHG